MAGNITLEMQLFVAQLLKDPNFILKFFGVAWTHIVIKSSF
jgi:hypothetical protein